MPFNPPGILLNPVVSVLKAPGGGVWVLSRDGAIYAFKAPDYDAPNRHPEYWGGRIAAKLVPSNGGQGYKVIDSLGSEYNYEPK